MKDQLLEQALARVMGWDGDQIAEYGAQLQQLAAWKYDDYEGYGPAGKFVESLVEWLWQMGPEQRQVAMEFVLRDLVFISAPEMLHTVQIVYPDVLRPRLIARAAEHLGISEAAVGRVAASDTFKEIRRKTLILGLSDGARLDSLRRSTEELSHEQFHLAPELGFEAIKSMRTGLVKALEKMELPGDAPRFEQVVLVDDFTGSGRTLLRYDDDDGNWKGKLVKARRHLELLREEKLVDDPEVWVVLYIASAAALTHLHGAMEDAGFDWELEVVQVLPAEIQVNDERLVALSEWFFDDVLIDEHKKVGGNDGRVPLGFGAGALPLVLHHNCPNNSISPLWADSTGRDGGEDRRALFPRYERHHSDRP
jgi:hypothetical protein